MAQTQNGRRVPLKRLKSPIVFFRTTLVAFSAALVVSVVLVMVSQRSVDRATEWVTHTLEVQGRLGDLNTDLVTADAAQVAVLLTGDQSHLTSYYRATNDIGVTLRSLSFLVADNPVQVQRIVQLNVLFRDKIREMDATVQTIRIGDESGALANARRNAQVSSTTTKIQSVLEAASRTEALVESRRQENLRRSAEKRNILSFAMIAMLAALLVGLFIAVQRARQYERLIKVCAWSKTVEYEGEWISYDEYLRRRFRVSVSHGISPDAMEKLGAET